MATTTNTPALTKVRSSVMNITDPFTGTSDAEWTTADGYRVYRLTDAFDYTDYKVIDQHGHHSSHDSMSDAREAVIWLRERGR